MEKKELMKQEEGFSPWDPFEDFRGIRNSMLGVLDKPLNAEIARILGAKNGNSYPTWSPRMDVEEKDKEYVVTAELPGVDKKDVKIEYKNHGLRLCGEKKAESETKNKNLIRQERFYGRFERYFALPEDAKASEAKALHKNGTLTIHIPRSEAAKPKTIEVKED